MVSARFGLSQDLSISRKEADEIIHKYFESYPAIKTFLDELVAKAKDTGYAQTMFGRRRPVPELNPVISCSVLLGNALP